MKDRDEELSSLTIQAQVLRRRCVAAHNQLHNDSGHSVIGEVLRCLPVRVQFDGTCDEHRLLSCYAFWGCEAIGGGRNGFKRRLDRSAPAPIQKLHRRIAGAQFGAWESESTATDEPMAWRAVERGDAPSIPVALVTNVDGETVQPRPGDMRAGWVFRQGEKWVLLFSVVLEEASADRLRETASEAGWHASGGGEVDGFQRVEYERDVLLQAVRPEYQTCGLDPYYFLPVSQRHVFPSRFAQALIDDLVRQYSRAEAPWHVRLARATNEDSLRTLRVRFEGARRRAARSAGRYRGDQIDPAHLPRLAPDADILEAFGLEPDGEVDLDVFSPLEMHPIEYLDLDDSWFEAASLSPKMPIGQALAHLKQVSDGELLERLERAVEAHRVRLRWVAVVRRANCEERESGGGLLREAAGRRLELGYDELFAAAEEVFRPAILDRRLARVLADEKRLAGRIEDALSNSVGGERPLRVGDLPQTASALRRVRGIGKKSISAITRCLREAMVSWADDLARPSGGSGGEGADGLASGLDELAALFE